MPDLSWLTGTVARGAATALDLVLNRRPKQRDGLVRSLADVGNVADLSPWRRLPGIPSAGVRDTAVREMRRAALGNVRAVVDGFEQHGADETMRRVTTLLDSYLGAGAKLGSGVTDLSLLDRLQRDLNAERQRALTSASRLIDKADAGDCSVPQLSSWLGQLASGSVHTAAQIGGMAWAETTVRRVLAVESDHCETCPAKARTYRSLDECLAACGGYPGAGGDDCHHNCNCRLEPGELYSVFANPLESLAAQGGVHTPLRAGA